MHGLAEEMTAVTFPQKNSSTVSAGINKNQTVLKGVKVKAAKKAPTEVSVRNAPIHVPLSLVVAKSPRYL